MGRYRLERHRRIEKHTCRFKHTGIRGAWLSAMIHEWNKTVKHED